MAFGRKTGGRLKGTPNRRTAEVAERLAVLGCDPIEGMARIAMDTSNAPELRGRMYAELAQYVAPKRKALDLNDTAQAVTIQLGIPRRVPQEPSKVDGSGS
jgi:hypothetical protein